MSDDDQALEMADLLARLVPARITEHSRLDRYRDFRKVFLGTDEGRRVLDFILWMAHVTRPHNGVGSAELLHHAEGRRKLALEIAGITYVEPTDNVERRDGGVAANKQWIKE